LYVIMSFDYGTVVGPELDYAKVCPVPAANIFHQQPAQASFIDCTSTFCTSSKQESNPQIQFCQSITIQFCKTSQYPPMALAPKFVGQRFTPHSVATTLHTIELYLDYVCPYSYKMFNTIYDSVFPLVKEKKYNVQFLFRHQVQPW